MSLLSPRFSSSSTLNRVAVNAAKLTVGSSGRTVHLVQMALLDLGYALPLSIGNPNYSPGGIYGQETARVVKQFQKDCPTLTQDAVAGRHPLKELDESAGIPQKDVAMRLMSATIHFMA